MKICSGKNELNIRSNEINKYQKGNEYDEMIYSIKNNIGNEKYSLNTETEANINKKHIYTNLMNNNKNFRYYFEFKKSLIEKKKYLIKSNSNNYMNIKKNNQATKVNDEYEDIKLKIKLGLMKKNRYNNEINKNKNRMDINHIIIEKTKKILKEKNKKLENKLNKNKNKENKTLIKIKNLLEKNNINNYNYFFKGL